MKPTTNTLLVALFSAFNSVTAFALDRHVDAVIRTVEAAKGKVEKTEDGQSLKLVDLAVSGAGPHGFHRLAKVSHRGSSIDDEGLTELCDHLPSLESISLAHAKFTDAGVGASGKAH